LGSFLAGVTAATWRKLAGKARHRKRGNVRGKNTSEMHEVEVGVGDESS
jgi:hypothetical protein